MIFFRLSLCLKIYIVTDMGVPALFLDRDGVINIDHGYVYRIEDFKFIPGIFSFVREFVELGYKVIVVTNQAGIGRGYYTEEDFYHLTRWMQAEFLASNAPINAVYHCPYHPEHGKGAFRQDSDERKPKPGMFFKAARDWDIDLQKSVIVGDHVTDISAAIAAGITQRFLFRSNESSDQAICTHDFSEIIWHIRSNTQSHP
jgi:D-glycero-D-manno-heptose 1,7-bisphosphate phosphatase